MENTLYLIALSLIPSIGSVTARKLISYLGSAEAVFAEKREKLMKIPGIGEVLSSRTRVGDFVSRAEKEILFCRKEGIRILDINHPDFPVRLKHCNDSPLVMYIKGDTDLNAEQVVSIVGTRKASREGIANTGSLVKEISEYYPETLIISGLAYGIDFNAHLSALKNNLQTGAVLAHGLHTLYPSEHKNIAMKIRKSGCLITEFTSEMNPERNNFIRRNRLIAGLADATVIVESGNKGGALITADIAASYNRDVFAFPGRVKDEYSKGCNRLIKENKAALIENLADIEYFMNWKRTGQVQAPRQKLLFIELTEEEERVVEKIRNNKSIARDSLSLELGIPVHKLASILLNLEFEGLITVLPGNLYTLS